jgi:hypothetical protein
LLLATVGTTVNAEMAVSVLFYARASADKHATNIYAATAGLESGQQTSSTKEGRASHQSVGS